MQVVICWYRIFSLKKNPVPPVTEIFNGLDLHPISHHIMKIYHYTNIIFKIESCSKPLTLSFSHLNFHNTLNLATTTSLAIFFVNIDDIKIIQSLASFKQIVLCISCTMYRNIVYFLIIFSALRFFQIHYVSSCFLLPNTF